MISGGEAFGRLGFPEVTKWDLPDGNNTHIRGDTKEDCSHSLRHVGAQSSYIIRKRVSPEPHYEVTLTSDLQTCVQINFCVCHPVYGILSWNPAQTKMTPQALLLLDVVLDHRCQRGDRAGDTGFQMISVGQRPCHSRTNKTKQNYQFM